MQGWTGGGGGETHLSSTFSRVLPSSPIMYQYKQTKQQAWTQLRKYYVYIAQEKGRETQEVLLAREGESLGRCSEFNGFKHVYLNGRIRVPTGGKAGWLLLVCLHSN